jgi:cysteine desulfurase/selenocysteine lyase
VKIRPEKIRQDFPVLQQEVHGKPLVYFDNGATTQKPRQVIECINTFHSEKNSSIHRGIHHLSEQATTAYEDARKKVQAFINAASEKEIVFTPGTTASINGLAFSYGERYLKEGDEIILSEMEHHANIVPWQMLRDRKNVSLKIIPFDDAGNLQVGELIHLITAKTKLIAVTHVSNILGTVNPVKEIIEIAHQQDIPVLIDGAQAVQHQQVDVQDLDCDFYVFSGHKIYGPTGIGVLYGKEKWLEELPPFQGGGEMVHEVSFEKTTYADLPLKFEAGTPNYIGAIGLGSALDYLTGLGIKNIKRAEEKIKAYTEVRLETIKGLKIIGAPKQKISIFSFTLEGLHHYDVGMIIDKMGIAVRTGTHCGQPIMQHYGIEGTIRASLVFYNSREDVDRFLDALEKARQMLS